MKRIFALSLRVHGISSLAAGIILFLVADKLKPTEQILTILPLGIGSLFLFLGFSIMSMGAQVENMVNEARGIEKENSEE